MPTLHTARCRSLLAAAILPWAACTSVEWQEIPPGKPTSWRHLQLHRAELAYVLAADEGGAAATYEQVEEVVRTVRDIAQRDPGPGLIIVVSRRDPLLIEDPKRLGRQMARWHATITGTSEAAFRPDSGPDFTMGGGRGPAARIDPAAMIRLMPAGVPLDDPLLGLPPELVADVRWIAVVPSPACVEEIVDELIDAAMAEADLSFFERMLAAAFMGTVHGMAYDAIQEQILVRLYEICAAASGGGPAACRAALLACLQHAGLAAEGAARTDTPELPESLTTEQVQMLAMFDIRELHMPGTGMGLVGGSATPTAYQLSGTRRLGWGLLVDLRPPAEREGDDLAAAARELDLQYRALPMAGISELNPARAHELDALLRAHRDQFALVFATSSETAAALLAGKAFWVDGASRAEALELGRHYGLRRLESEVAAQLDKR